MISYDKKKMGELLRRRRILANFTQARVARTLGYSSPQFLSNIERGISVVPIETLGKLIRLYRFDKNEVLNLIMAGAEQTLCQALMQRSPKRRARRL
jgi:transcriptional regulator with XRE-family HTH domain